MRPTPQAVNTSGQNLWIIPGELGFARIGPCPYGATGGAGGGSGRPRGGGPGGPAGGGRAGSGGGWGRPRIYGGLGRWRTRRCRGERTARLISAARRGDHGEEVVGGLGPVGG